MVHDCDDEAVVHPRFGAVACDGVEASGVVRGGCGVVRRDVVALLEWHDRESPNRQQREVDFPRLAVGKNGNDWPVEDKRVDRARDDEHMFLREQPHLRSSKRSQRCNNHTPNDEGVPSHRCFREKYYQTRDHRDMDVVNRHHRATYTGHRECDERIGGSCRSLEWNTYLQSSDKDQLGGILVFRSRAVRHRGSHVIKEVYSISLWFPSSLDILRDSQDGHDDAAV